MVKDIKFIKTDKTSEKLEKIQKDYPNSIINVNSNRERNVYIGDYRITDNYNLGVDENSITNDVGGISSGINASEFKGKSVSEILDTILFAKNNNLTLKGVVVVDKIDNLTDDTLKDVYQGMVVSVIEDNSLYILLSDSDIDFGEREWERVGSYSKLSAPIKVAGIGKLGNIKDGDEYKIGHSIEDILRDILCTELYSKEIKLKTIHSEINFGNSYIIGATAENYSELMKVGSELKLNEVTLKAATITECSRQGIGFEHGYSADNDNSKDKDGNPEKKVGTYGFKENETYTLTEKYSGIKEGKERTSTPSSKHTDVKLISQNVKIGLGKNTISFTAYSPGGNYILPNYPDYYDVSNLGNTSDEHKLVGASEESKTLDPVKGVTSISVIGVYPVYVNIDSGSFVNETKEMPLTNSSEILFEGIPAETTDLRFTFDYPATHEVKYFKIKDIKGDFVDFAASYDKEIEIGTKDVCGDKIQYKRLITRSQQGPDLTYKIILSKGLDGDE